MKISHESPLVLLEESRKFNDYDYALVHLFDNNPIYYNFFIESLKMGREVILDNSVFELGEAYDADVFVEWIEKLKPTYYIIPDVLDDTDKTINSLKEFINKYKNLPGKSIGVIQGTTYEDICRCYKEIEPLVDKVAISFDSAVYNTLIQEEELNIWQRWCRGRQELLKRLLKDNIINVSKPHHLLGIALPQEIKEYKNYHWIDSIDTSNPVVHGLHEIQYENGELQHKISTKLVDLLYSEVNNTQLLYILDNVNQFKNNINE